MEIIKKLEERKRKLERISILAKEKELFISCKLNLKIKFIYSNFGKMSATQLAKKLNVNRSYVYAVIEKSLKFKTKAEVSVNSSPE